MAEKHIFIGLGGSGVSTVSKVKYKIYEKIKPTSLQSRLDLLNHDYRFIFIDTDNKDINSANKEFASRFEGGKEKFINENKELVDLGLNNPKAIYREAKNNTNIRLLKRIVESCNDKVAAKMANITMRDGAGAFRMQSRISFSKMSDDFISKLRTSITDLNSIDKGATEQSTIYYWVVGSSNGGTGSGIVNDVLYYVNMLHKQIINDEDPSVVLMLYMPQFYIDANSTKDRYPKNAFSTMSEIEAFQCAAMDKDYNTVFHRLALLKDYHQFDTETPYRPFRYCIPIDYQTEEDTNFGNIKNMYQNTAEMLYYLHSGEGAGSFKSTMSNSIEDVKVKDAKSFLIPMGYIALRKPEKDFEDYMLIRLKYELVKYGIIGANELTTEEKRKQAEITYNNIISKVLFDGGADSFSRKLKSLVEKRLDEDLPDNIIRDSDNKPLNKLPTNVSNETAENIIIDVERAIKRNGLLKEETLKTIENNLWDWVEENSIKYGLEYVKDILFELDGYCTDLYNSYILDSGKGVSKRKAKQNNIASLADNLDSLYNEALEIKLAERIKGSNHQDVIKYFNCLKEYVSAKLDFVIHDEIYDILRDLCFDNNGSIDKIQHYVSALMGEAYQLLNTDKGVEVEYSHLAKDFSRKIEDVTSVYLPDIQDFADGFGWKENLFSDLYKEIIEPSNRFDRGKGFIPARNGGSRSLEGFLNSVKTLNNEKLVHQGFINNEKVHLFINHRVTNKKKILEDILSFATSTMTALCNGNKTITDFRAKTLPILFDELSNEEREVIRKRLSPMLFFTYNRAKMNNLLETYNFYVANTREIAENILQYDSNDRNSIFSASSDPSSMFIIKSRVGIAFDFYRTYNTIKREYDATAEKEEFHFHAAFAASNGDYTKISLPEETEPQMITFAKYLILDAYKDFLKDSYYQSSNSFDKDNFTNTPFFLEENRALFAVENNITQKGDFVCIEKKDGSGKELFTSIVIGLDEPLYKGVYHGFKQKIIDNRFEQSISKIISLLERNSPVEMERFYPQALSKLKAELDKQWVGASKSDKAILSYILRTLTNELNSYDKFKL